MGTKCWMSDVDDCENAAVAEFRLQNRPDGHTDDWTPVCWKHMAYAFYDYDGPGMVFEVRTCRSLDAARHEARPEGRE